MSKEERGGRREEREGKRKGKRERGRGRGGEERRTEGSKREGRRWEGRGGHGRVNTFRGASEIISGIEVLYFFKRLFSIVLKHIHGWIKKVM